MLAAAGRFDHRHPFRVRFNGQRPRPPCLRTGIPSDATRIQGVCVCVIWCVDIGPKETQDDSGARQPGAAQSSAAPSQAPSSGGGQLVAGSTGAGVSTSPSSRRKQNAKVSVAEASSGSAASLGVSFSSLGTSQDPSGGGVVASCNVCAAMAPSAPTQPSLVAPPTSWTTTSSSSAAVQKATPKAMPQAMPKAPP